MRKGFVHVVPLVVFAVLLLSGFFLVSNNNIQNQKNAVGKVLADSTEDHGGDGSNSGASQNNQLQNQPEFKPSESHHPSTERPEIKRPEVKSQDNLEFTSNQNGNQIEIRKGETQIQSGGFHLQIQNEGGKIVTKIENDKEGSPAAKEVENEIENQVEKELEKEDIHLASGSAGLGFTEKSHRVRTNFPLSVNPQTGQLSVTTPAGTKVVAILPSVAIENMIKAGVLTNTNQGTGSTGGGTSSATLNNPAIELTTVNNQAAFVIDGFKQKKFLGVLPVNISKQTVVSAENGQLLDVREGVLAKTLDIFSF